LAPAAAEQRELALILKPAAAFKLVLGAFDLERGYFGTDGIGGDYRMLGRVRHRGLEFSAAGKVVDRLNVVLGGVLIDPEVGIRSGGESDDFRPIGVPRIRLLASADYQLPRSEVHFDGSIQFTGSRPAILSSDGSTLSVPATWTANLGARAPIAIGPVRSTVRFQLFNLFDNFTWDPTSAGTMAYSPSRRFRLVLTSEF
jgi:iron complex outermembrane receptor protein